MFPLNTVLFPGVSVPLHVFEERYRALVRRLLEQPDPAERLFGSFAIREGYEVGEHGGQSLHRVGCYLQLTDVERNDDGTYDIVAVGRGRVRLDSVDSSGDYLAGEVERLADADDRVHPALTEQAQQVFAAYRGTLSELRGSDVLAGELPSDATYLSWSLAATCLLNLQQRQLLLEADSTGERLALVTDMMRDELAAMRALPSLPATEVARTRWSPN
jgi:Lon protease-like protein